MLDRRQSLMTVAGLVAAGRLRGQDVPRTAGLTVRMHQPENLEGPLGELADAFLTPVEKFYVRSHFAVPKLDAESFRLTVDGLVDNPLTLSLADLKGMAPTSRPLTLECAGNGRVFLTPPVPGLQWGQGAVGTADWDGVPLGAVLDRAKVKAGATDVVLTGADSGGIAGPPASPGVIPFDRGIPLAKCRRDETLLAWGMNGRPLTPGHGFPLRAVVGGWYGMAAVKWLTRVTVTDRPHAGFWQTLDYSHFRREGGRPTLVPVAEVQPKAVISRPASGEVVPAGKPYRLVGLAWAGEQAVDRVEVSSDGGATWRPAAVEKHPAAFCWRRWTFDWTPAATGPVGLLARCTDSAGRTQPDKRDPDRRTYMINHLVPVPVTVGKDWGGAGHRGGHVMTRRALLAVLVVAAGWGEVSAIDPAGRAAVDRGVAFLRGRFAGGPTGGSVGNHGLGEAALAGLAMLEGGAPATDPTVEAIAAAVRKQCLPDQQTYHVALCVLFLDRLGEPGDRGLIQVLGVKLYAGLLATGGYGYTLDDGWTGDVNQTLSALQDTNTLRTRPADPKGARPPGGFAPPPAAKKKEESPTGLHPLAEQYFKLVKARVAGNRRNDPGDNSNTQFGLIGLWVASRNGLPAEDAFFLIERRFLTSQTNSGWQYNPGSGETTVSMTCAGLLGLAVGAGRSSATPPDRKVPQPRPEGFAPAPPKKEKDDGPNLEGVKNKRAVAAALAYLAARVRVRVADLGGAAFGAGNAYYLLWSLERVCMAYSLPDLGGVDWYQWGVDFLLPAQQADGSWPAGSNCSAEVDTCFAILFLMKSNLVSDLSKIIKPVERTLKAGDGLPPAGTPRPDASKPADANPLVAASDADFPATLAAARDTVGANHTKTLSDAIPKLTGDRQTKARDALAERLTRMTAKTLRDRMKDGVEEVKRAAATAAASKADKSLQADLVDLIADPAEAVVQAARESLKKLTKADHGPPPGADAAAKAKAQAAWRAAIK